MQAFVFWFQVNGIIVGVGGRAQCTVSPPPTLLDPPTLPPTIRQKGESQDGGNKKAKHATFSEKHVRVSEVKEYSFFGKFYLLCFLVTSVLRFTLLPYRWFFFRTDTFKITAGNLGPLQKITVRNDNSNASSDWNLEKVVINDTLGNSYRFPANVWLSNQPGKQLEMTFDLSKYQDLLIHFRPMFRFYTPY